MNIKEVTKQEYCDFIKDKNLVYSPDEDNWKDRSGNLFAKKIPVGKHYGISSDKYQYFIINY